MSVTGGLKSNKPVLGPLIFWSKTVLDESRKFGHDDLETARWINAYAQEQGWTCEQISEALIFNGVKRKNPLMIICPKCEEPGRLNIFHNNNSRKSKNNTQLVIVHGKLPGFWGKKNGSIRKRKRTRCWFYEVTQKEYNRLNEQMKEREMLGQRIIDLSKVKIVTQRRLGRKPKPKPDFVVYP